MPSLSPVIGVALAVAFGTTALAGQVATAPPAQTANRLRIETRPRGSSVVDRFTSSELTVLEKLNRADIAHLDHLATLVMPAESWQFDDGAYTNLPPRLTAGAPLPPKVIVAFLPGQLFGAYEHGILVRWGPLSSGWRGSPTPAGSYHLNWRSVGRTSTSDPSWFMRWYFNFGNREGLAFHEYSLPGLPASHGCVRLLERDAQWLFEWGGGWILDGSGSRIETPGTPVFVVGQYDFDAPPPWRSPEWLGHEIDLSAIVRMMRP